MVRHTATLVHYDGAQVFEGRDSIGGRYVGMMIDSGDDADRYLVTGVAPGRLRQFRSGDLDLRTLLLEAGREGWYFADVPDGLWKPLRLARQNGSLDRQAFLPDEGCVLGASVVRPRARRHNQTREASDATSIFSSGTTIPNTLGFRKLSVNHA